MRVLVTNDDGVNSPGLWSIVEALKDEAEVSVVAPDRDQSGIGAAITLSSAVRAHQVMPHVDGIKTFAVEGTPGDCVILASETLFDQPFDLVLSGINPGANLGLDVMNSGTVGAAVHGYNCGIPSIAVSVAYDPDVRYEEAARTSRTLARVFSRNSNPAPVLLNVNVPGVSSERIERVEITTLGPRAYVPSVERGSDGRRTHYWIKQDRPESGDARKGTDVWSVRNNRVSITRLNLGLADHQPQLDLQALADEVAAALGVGEGG